MLLINDASDQKLRGGYYTPSPIASFLLHWGIDDSIDADILEPCCGDGIFLKQILMEKMLFNHITAIEYDVLEAEKARSIGLYKSEVINTDFHRFCLDTKHRYNLIVGNPPFIRYQYYDEKQQELANIIFKNAGINRSKLSNAWGTFVVGCSLLLREQGKMGFVIPSELLQVTHAKQLRKFISSFFNKITIISFENLVFKNIQQEVVLLLCEKNGTNDHFINHLEVKDIEALHTIKYKEIITKKRINFYMDKWNYYFLDQNEIDFLIDIRNTEMHKIGDYANVEVGITTGANDYFTVTKNIVDFYHLQKYAYPMVGRSVQVNSLCFSRDDWKRNLNLGAKANLLVFPPMVVNRGEEGVIAYIKKGENEGINSGYKTSIRDFWYVIPSIKISQALFLRRNNLYPKFVLNEAEAYTTDTMHRVFINKDINNKSFVVSYYNSLSFAFAEILGRNFGGGVLELMPSEVEGIYIPYFANNIEKFDIVDKMVRDKKTMDEILDFTDTEFLQKNFGFSKNELIISRSILYKLMRRRLNRKSIKN